MKAITQCDYEILLYIQNHLRTPFGNGFFSFMTFLGEFGWFWIALCVMLLVSKKTRRSGIVLLLALFLSWSLGEGLLKHIFLRTRPYIAHPDLIPLARRPRSSSFPSGHTATACAMGFTALRELRKRYSIPIFIIGLLVSLSRLYLGMHYPTDVITGILLGLFSCCLAERLMWRLQDKSLLKHLA
jgi:membrane-associated phospholipid phosphatase